jgi:hypothetical protein
MKTNPSSDSKNGEATPATGKLTKYVPPADTEKAGAGDYVGEPLTLAEKTELHRCEAVISDAFEKGFEAGRALLTIRDGKLYKSEQATFEDYCRARWGYSKTHANRLIGAAGVANVLAPIGVTVENESQVRPLTGLKPAKVTKAWQKATKLAGEGKVTAALVRRAVNEIDGKPEKKKKKPSKNAKALALLNKVEDAINAKEITNAITLLRKLRALLNA